MTRRNLDVILQHDCTEQDCDEPTKKLIRADMIRSGDETTYIKRYVCENDKCPYRMSHTEKMGTNDFRFRGILPRYCGGMKHE